MLNSAVWVSKGLFPLIWNKTMAHKCVCCCFGRLGLLRPLCVSAHFLCNDTVWCSTEEKSHKRCFSGFFPELSSTPDPSKPNLPPSTHHSVPILTNSSLENVAKHHCFHGCCDASPYSNSTPLFVKCSHFQHFLVFSFSICSYFLGIFLICFPLTKITATYWTNYFVSCPDWVSSSELIEPHRHGKRRSTAPLRLAGA